MNPTASRPPDVSDLDPRPRWHAGPGSDEIRGIRCPACGHVAAYPWPSCPDCGGPADPATFGPGGVVWSSTVVRIPVPGRTPPYGLAYVDLDDGPRVLAHVVGTADPPPLGTRVRFLGPSDAGDPQVEVAS